MTVASKPCSGNPWHNALITRIWKRAPLVASLLALGMPCLVNASTCFGAVGNGRLSDGVRLPPQGDNFVAYSSAGVELGRNLRAQPRARSCVGRVRER